MQTDRLTVLMDPAYKAAVASQAAKRGVSTSEHVRNALDSFDTMTEAEEVELAALVAQVNEAIPRMQASLVRTCEKMEAFHAEMDVFFKEKGIK